ncbi:MAG: hypothetical protein ACKOQ2_24490, partial [Dolichospermum sp.]
GKGWWKAGEDPEIEPIPNTDNMWTSYWVRNGCPLLGGDDIVVEMTKEVEEFQKLGIPTVREIKLKKDAKGNVWQEAMSKAAVSTALQKARLKLILVATMEKMHLNEGYDLDSQIIYDTVQAMIRCINESLSNTSNNKYVRKQFRELPSRTRRILRAL